MVILFANRRLAELLSRPAGDDRRLALTMFVAGSLITVDTRSMAGRVWAPRSNSISSTATAALCRSWSGSSPLEIDGDELTCLTFTDLSGQKAQDREIVRLGEAQAERMADLQDAQAALTKQATHDALTGLPNRALLVDRIDQVLCQSKRSRRCTAVLFVDLDRFKQINDTQGHAAGDIVLRSVAEQLAAVAAAAWTPSPASVATSSSSSRQRREPACTPSTSAPAWSPSCATGPSDDGERVGASVGISVSIGGRGTAEILLNEADKAMYQAKSLGGGRVEVFDAALGRHVQRRSTAQRMLQSALDDGRVIVYYQPVVDLSSGHVAGFEALARIAEHDGTIVPPARLHLRRRRERSGGAARHAGAGDGVRRGEPAGIRRRRPSAPLTIAVNLSARQFEPGDLTSVVRRDA